MVIDTYLIIFVGSVQMVPAEFGNLEIVPA